MKKSIFFWLYFVGSIILATYFACRIITSQMGRGPISSVKHIHITNNSNDFNPDAIKMAIGISGETNIRSIDLRQINKLVLGVPGIKKSATRRLSNGDIIIKTEKYNVVAVWSDGVYYYPLSSDGTKIDTPSDTYNENALVFRGEVPNDLTDIINSASVLSEYIDYIKMVESRRWNIHTKNGTTIYLPENNFADAINKINVLNQTHKILSRQIDIIDMRDKARILVKTKK
jgi:cell division protein FtsQ